ncbi:hypothetical protein ACPPVU_12685 [Mucilaginibacter sp. McL0603]|uniref:hypothetical protein n=1 Tax=Mucilaginibacter sp. McL0603 TaxID=3415670 RepID=UPI003CF46B83
MKKLFFILSLITNLCFGKQLFAQQLITVQNLVGVWQYGSPTVGDQLNQSFVFFKNGHFFFNNGKLGDDLVSTRGLKGRYRLDKNKMYFTIISRLLVDNANIDVATPEVESGIFLYKDIIPNEVFINGPKEIKDPVDLIVIKPNHIKINDEDYYKVSSRPDATKL